MASSTDITNQQIYDAAKALGYQVPENFDKAGSQNTQFRNNLLAAIATQTQGRQTPDVWNQLKGAARGLKAIPANASNQDKMLGTLRALGASPHQINQIILAAQHPTTPGIRAPGQVGDSDYADAVLKILGPDNNITRQTLTAGGRQEQLPQPPPAAPSGLAGGGISGFGTNVSRATPGVHAQEQPSPALPKPAPAGGPGAPGKGAGAGTGGGAGGAGAPDLTPKNDDEAVAMLQKQYGKDAWMLDIPEVRRIVLDTLKNPSGVSQGIIDSAIMKTTWWQQNGQHVADFLSDKTTDATGLNTKIHDKALQVQSRGSAVGMDIPYDRAVEIATDWQKWGWEDSQVQGALSGEFHYQAGQHTTLIDSLTDTAHKYYTPISDGTIQAWGQKIIAGTDNLANFQEFSKNQARSLFPGASARLDGGETMEDIAKPYATLASQYLEIDPNDFDPMKDPKWMAALDQVDPKTGVKTTMSNNDWIKKIRTDPSYGFNQTKQAKDAAVGFATEIGKAFGMVA